MAHNIKSPGVDVQVLDNTSSVAATQGAVAAAVGFAEKGPIGVPTLVLSNDQFKSTFGNPIQNNYYMGMYAEKFLAVSTSWFTRIAKANAFEAVTGTVTPGLDYTLLATPTFWIELSGFPIPNNGIYRITWTGTTIYANITALASAINGALGTTLLADGVSFMQSLISAGTDTGGTKLTIVSDVYQNIVITVHADTAAAGANNVAKITGAGNIGIADGASSVDTGSAAYAFVRVPVSVVAATSGSITATAAMIATDLNKLSAFNLINLVVDGTLANPYRTFSNVNITPTTGNAATFPTLSALSAPILSHDWTTGGNQSIKITLAGFYAFVTGDLTGQVNTQFTVQTITFTTGTLGALITALNTAMHAVSVGGTSKLDDYIKFSSVGNNLTLINGNASKANFGSQCTVALANGTPAGQISDLGYSTVNNFTGAGVDATYTASGVAAAIIAGTQGLIKAVASSSILTISSIRTGTTSFIEILTATTSASDAGPVIHFSSATSATGVNETNSGVVNFVSLTSGGYGNRVSVMTYTTVNPVTLANQYYVQVFYNGQSVENFGPVNWTDSSASNFIKTVIANSVYVTVDFGKSVNYPNPDTGTVPSAPPPNNSDLGQPTFWVLDGGNNGIPSAGTDADALAVTALDAYSNVEQYPIDVLLAPGFVSPAVSSKLQSVGENRQDIVVLIDPPPYLDYITVLNWSNGQYQTSTNLTSSYAVATWDWQKDFDDVNSQYVDLPPSIYMAVAMASTQANSEVWEAPAGPVNGVVNSISSYSKPTQAQRELLNNDVDPAIINPIVQFPTAGIMIYGQKTCSRLTKSTNRINVRRNVNNIKRNVQAIGQKYIFKLNTASTWAAISRELNSFLGNIQERGGLYSYTVIFDGTTTTQTFIDQEIMYGKIFIQPTKVAERIFIDITIQNTGALTGGGG